MIITLTIEVDDSFTQEDIINLEMALVLPLEDFGKAIKAYEFKTDSRE